MKIVGAGGQEFDVTPTNALWMHYQDNDLTDGLFIDVDDNQFAFYSRWSDGGEELMDMAARNGIRWVDVEPDIDRSEVPHAWIENVLAHQFAQYCEIVAIQAADGGETYGEA